MRTLAGLSLLLLVGMLLGASMLVYTAYVLVAVFWFSNYLSARWTNSLSAVRTLTRDELEVGEETAIQIRLNNNDTWPVTWVLLEDVLPGPAIRGTHPALALAGEHLRATSVPAKSGRVVAYKLTALRRGYFQIGPVIAETGDLLGLHRRFRRLSGASYVLVLPKLMPLSGYDVASRRPVGEVNVSYRLLEDPTLVSGIRDYQHGDPIRSIHWRATARTGKLQCKMYQPTCVAGATLVLDMHQATNPDQHEPVRTDLAVTAAASICHTLMLMQQQFGLISNGRDAADRLSKTVGKSDQAEFESLENAKTALQMKSSSDRLRPVIVDCSRGPDQFTMIHRTLARLERTDGILLEDLLLESQNHLPRDATVLVILQEVTETAALALGLLVRQGYSVSAIVNNYDNEAFQTAVGRLLANRITTYHLFDEDSIPQICKEMVLRY